MVTVDANLEERAEQLEAAVSFLYDQVTEDDRTTVRSMLLLNATNEQITKSLAIAANNTRVDREDKSRYAFGCLRNIMMEDPIARDKDLIDA